MHRISLHFVHLNHSTLCRITTANFPIGYFTNRLMYLHVLPYAQPTFAARNLQNLHRWNALALPPHLKIKMHQCIKTNALYFTCKNNLLNSVISIFLNSYDIRAFCVHIFPTVTVTVILTLIKG